jgi:hypothetical protein
MKKDLTASVLDWLGRTGYPLELRVGKVLQKAGWHVNYGRRYTDPESGKSRELDVQALVGGISRGNASVFYSLCIECKSSKDKPWVALDTGAIIDEHIYSYLALGDLSDMVVVAANSEKLPLPRLFAANTPRVGGVVQALGTKDDHAPVSPFAALMQVRSAALALDAEFHKMSDDLSAEVSTATLFVPIVVLEGKLFKYSIDNDSKESLSEVDLVFASVPGGAERADAVVPIFTRDYFVSQATRLYTEAHNFSVAMLPHASTIRAAARIAASDD